MKHIDREAQRRLLREQRQLNQKSEDLYLAKSKHKKMKNVFKGIQSYPNRKILFEIGKHNGS